MIEYNNKMSLIANIIKFLKALFKDNQELKDNFDIKALPPMSRAERRKLCRAMGWSMKRATEMPKLEPIRW